MLNTATLVESSDATVIVQDTVQMEARKGSLLRAIAGGRSGLLGGPAGAVAGAHVGAGAGSLAAKRIGASFWHESLKNFQEVLQHGCAVLIVLVDVQWVQELSEAFADRGHYPATDAGGRAWRGTRRYRSG